MKAYNVEITEIETIKKGKEFLNGKHTVYAESAVDAYMIAFRFCGFSEGFTAGVTKIIDKENPSNKKNDNFYKLLGKRATIYVERA